MTAQLELLALSAISDHPRNPRLVFREDVIAGIAANLNGEYPQQHAISVRKRGDVYETLSGHHRSRAARKAGLTHVWAWVEDMDDDAAFMRLATSNNQGELSPLEIGMHALNAVPLEKGGRGKKGGLAEYAAKIGKQPSRITEYRQGAGVLRECEETIPSMERFLDKAQHLAAIHSLPRECWPAAVGAIGMDSAARVKERVDQAVAFYESHGIPQQWQDVLIPWKCCQLVFAGADPNSFRRLAAIAEQVHADLTDRKHFDLADEWRSWLEACDQPSVKSWQDKRIELEQVAWERENAGAPEQVAVSVLLADPPWQYDFAATDSRQIENQYPTATAEEIGTHISLPWVPPLADDCVLFMWATAPKLREALQVMDKWGFAYKTHAIWDKERLGMGYWFRGQHELLLVGTRGTMSPPDAAARVSSVFREKREAKHSQKPECVYEAIESMFPDSVRFEMYQRRPREGWKGGGNEVRS